MTNQRNKVTVTENVNNVLTVTTQGVQGPAFSLSGRTLDDANAVDGSLLRLSLSEGKFIADSSVTVENIVDGGNF
tara:strand:- start:217 stop:441 length:225 start_codon:yes stop_codon:yes gene_type:complete